MSATQKVYVLFGTTGEYSDRSEWVVCAYAHREDADADCTALNEMARGLGDLRGHARDAAVAERLTPHDANVEVDYTGVDYSVEDVEVFAARRVPS